MAIILTLAALAVPNLMAALDQSKIARAVGDEDEISLGDYKCGMTVSR
jgi:hypothetical protein